MTEQWRSVPDFPGYEVSNHGRVRSYHVQGGGISQWPERILRPNTFGKYPRVRLCKNGRSFGFAVHRIVTRAFLGSCPESLEVCHTDDDPNNNRLSNLRYDTHSANFQDAVKNGLRKARRKDMRKVVATNVELSADVRAMLDRMRTEDLRTLKGELEWIIKERYRQRYNQMVEPGASEPGEAE